MTRCSVWMAFGLVFSASAAASEPPHISSADLACGATRLHSQTTSIAHVPPDDHLVWAAQTITLASNHGLPHLLRMFGLDDRPAQLKERGLPAIVSSWQCLHGSRGDVILLWFACTRTDLGGFCHGEREWERLLDPDGRPLDEGYAPQDPRYEALTRRLGLPEGDNHMQDALGE